MICPDRKLEAGPAREHSEWNDSSGDLCVRTLLFRNYGAVFAFFLLPLVLLLVLMALWFMAAPLMPMLIVSYELRFADVLRYAFLMTFISLPRSIAIRLATLIMPISLLAGIYFFPGEAGWLLALGCLSYIVFLLSFNKLLWASYANALGEKYLNPRIPGAPTNIGLRPKRNE